LLKSRSIIHYSVVVSDFLMAVGLDDRREIEATILVVIHFVVTGNPMEDKRAEGDNSKLDRGVLPTATAAKGVEEQPIPSDQGDATANAANAAHRAWQWTCTKLHSAWGFIKAPESTNVAIAAATIVIAFATCYTYLEVHSGGTQTDKIIAADERIAKAMESAVGQAGNALNASIEASRTDQRAWVGAVAITGIPVIGSSWIVTITSKNTGKTFAKAFRMKATVAKVSPPHTDPDFTEEPVPYGSISILAPNGEYTSTNVVTGDAKSRHPIANPTQADLDLIRACSH
jgi:hypothetical protein